LKTRKTQPNAEFARKLFEQVRSGAISPDEAVVKLRHLPFEDLGFAKVDHHRALRVGVPEVVFGQGKTPQQLAQIFARLAEHGGNLLATRVNDAQFAAVKKKCDRQNTGRSLGPLFYRETKRSTAKD
jgi:pyridinium-3,5-biscarboxylic acid mononucleotide synthase